MSVVAVPICEEARSFANLVNLPPNARLSGRFGVAGLAVGDAGARTRFTGGYLRTNKLDAAVLYGAVPGFVVYVVTGLADLFWRAGLLDPARAAGRTAPAAIVVGLTVLLNREDGRTR